MIRDPLSLREVNLDILLKSNNGQKRMMLCVGSGEEFLARIHGKWLEGTFMVRPPHPQVLFYPVDWNPAGHEVSYGLGWEGIWKIEKR
jgi:hypothetical protein